jgi:histone H3/H4
MTRDEYVSVVVGTSVAHMLKEIGFQGAEVCAHRTLGSVLERYVQEIGAAMAETANLAGRTLVNENDFRFAMTEFDRDGDTGRDVVRSLLNWKQTVLDPKADIRDVPVVPPFATRPISEPIGLRSLSDVTSTSSSSSSSSSSSPHSSTSRSIVSDAKREIFESHIPSHLPSPPISTPVCGKRPRLSAEEAFRKKFKERRGIEAALVQVQRAIKQASPVTDN